MLGTVVPPTLSKWYCWLLQMFGNETLARLNSTSKGCLYRNLQNLTFLELKLPKSIPLARLEFQKKYPCGQHIPGTFIMEEPPPHVLDVNE